MSAYYDDFDPNDKFNRVLFRPKVVQARELTTLQSILQNQVERNGRHFFKEGSMVVRGQISTTNKYYAVKLQQHLVETQYQHIYHLMLEKLLLVLLVVLLQG